MTDKEIFTLSAEELDAIEHEKHHYEDPRAASIEALKLVQKARLGARRRNHRYCRRAGHSRQ